MKRKNLEYGFTLPELIIVLAIIGLIFSFAVVNLINVQYKSSLNATLTQLLTDIKAQQNRAMANDTAGETQAQNFGVHFETNSYTLFHGTYVANSSSNLVVNLDNGIITTNVLFPSSQIIFNSKSGEISGFTSGSDTLSLTNTTATEQKVIKINRYGVITQVN